MQLYLIDILNGVIQNHIDIYIYAFTYLFISCESFKYLYLGMATVFASSSQFLKH